MHYALLLLVSLLLLLLLLLVVVVEVVVVATQLVVAIVIIMHSLIQPHQLTSRKRKEGMKEMFYLTTHTTHFVYGYIASDLMVKDHSHS